MYRSRRQKVDLDDNIKLNDYYIWIDERHTDPEFRKRAEPFKELGFLHMVTSANPSELFLQIEGIRRDFDAMNCGIQLVCSAEYVE